MKLKNNFIFFFSLNLSLLSLNACSAPAIEDAGTGDAGVDAGLHYEALSSTDLADISDVIPEATQREMIDIDPALLTEDDVENANTQVWILHSDDGNVVGYYRDIFTPVHCLSGACQAIYFAMIFDVNGDFLHVLHPSGSLHNILLKYWDGLEQPFDEADWAMLNDLCLHPPAVLLGVQSMDELVADATETAPTLVEYQDVVIRGAAFTTYQIVVSSVDTRQILQDIVTP